MFESFVNTLIVAYIRHSFMRDEIKAAGISLTDLPRGVLGRDIAAAYFQDLATMTPELAAHNREHDLALLEKFSDPFTAIPRDPQVLREKFQGLFNAHQFQKLADKLRLNPEAGQDLIKEFQLHEARGVEFQTLTELSILVGHQHALAKENKAVVLILGFEKLSRMIGGFNPERLGIALGGTGFGKTNLAINLTLAAARTMHTAYVNMEMGYQDMLKRFAVIGGGVDYADYAGGNFDPGSVQAELNRVGANIKITSGRALSFDQIASWIRIQHVRNPLGLVVIDYDQKVDLNLKHQVEEWKALQKVMEAFEDMAKELSLYVLILAQVNREGLISGSHRAQFPAHTVLAFHNHEIHGPVIEAKKNRHGRKAQALTVLYNEHNSRIFEGDVLTLEPATKQERIKLQPKPAKETFWQR